MTGPRRDEPVGPAAGSGAAHLHAATAAPDPVEPSAGRWRGLQARVGRLAAWWRQTRAARANARFGAAGGGVLTGGIAYAALFSVFAALTLGLTVLMAVLGSDAALRDAVVGAIRAALPGLIDTGDGSGGAVPVDSLRLSSGFTVAGLVAVVALVGSAISAVSALQTGVKAMFDVPGSGNVVVGRLRQLGGFAVMALAVLVSALLSLAATSAADWLTGLLHWSSSSGLVARGAGVAVSFVVDAATFVLVVRVLGEVRPARRDLRSGALIAAAGLGVVRVLGTSIVSGSVAANPLLASFAVIVVLLAWVNLIARIVLLAAAWTADPPLPH